MRKLQKSYSNCLASYQRYTRNQSSGEWGDRGRWLGGLNYKLQSRAKWNGQAASFEWKTEHTERVEVGWRLTQHVFFYSDPNRFSTLLVGSSYLLGKLKIFYNPWFPQFNQHKQVDNCPLSSLDWWALPALICPSSRLLTSFCGGPRFFMSYLRGLLLEMELQF